MAVGDELRKSYASDSGTYNLGLQTRPVGGDDAVALASAITEKKPPTKPSAHRSSVSSADTGDISGSSGTLDVGNSQYVALYAEFSAAGATAVLALALFDNQGTPAFVGVTEQASFTADSSWRNGSSGPYVSPRYIFDVSGASRVRAVVKSISSGNVTIYLVPL